MASPAESKYKQAIPLRAKVAMPALSPNQRGMMAVVLAMAAMVANDVAMKSAARSLPSFSQLVCLRAVFAALSAFALLALRGEAGGLRQTLRPLVLLRGALEVAGSFFFIAAITLMPIGDATAIIQVAPLLLLLAAAAALGERVGLDRLLACLVGFAGALLIAAPSGQVSPASLLALATAGAVAAREMIARHLGAAVPPLALACATCLIVAAAAGAGALRPGWIWPQPFVLALLAAAGMLLATGYVLLTVAIRGEEVQAVAPFYYVQTIFALAAGWLAFGDAPSPESLLGIALVLGAGIRVFSAPRLRGATPASKQGA